MMSNVIQFKKKSETICKFYYEVKGCYLESDTYWYSLRLIGTEDWSEWVELELRGNE